MSSEISSLFASIATNLQNPNPTAKNQVDFPISDLNRSLNPTQTQTTTRILDATLSLMCFTAPQVYDSAVDSTMKTIVTVLNSLVECSIDRYEVLRVGGSISQMHIVNVMDWCQHIMGKLGGHKSDLCYLLMYSVIRLVALAPSVHCAVTSKSNPGMNDYVVRDSFLKNVLCQFPSEIDFRSSKIPLRLLIWHLDPMVLKQDMSHILREVSERPFLSLSTELYERIDWRSKLICLVMSPSLFVEARALLHGWFLVVGLASIMELLTELVVQVMDIISRPMRWGVSMEAGCKLPFSHAYFPHNHQWLRTLSGPISHNYFQHLLHELSKSISHAGGQLQTSSNKAAKGIISTVDHKSMWAMAMNFPCWFSYASVVLFYENGSSKPFILNNVNVPSSVGAARYIAWIMYPLKESHQDVLVEHLARISELWTLKRFNLNDGSRGQLKENRRLKLRGKSNIMSHDMGIKTIWLWLKEFQDTYKYLEFRDGSSGFRTEGFSSCSNILLNRIPLGILIGYLNYLNIDGCALILHYAAIGDVNNFPESKVSEQRGKYGSNGDSVEWSTEYTRAEAVAGCRIVFDITDLTETITPAMFDNEDEALKFISQLKLKTGDYLVQCMKRLVQVKYEKDDHVMQKDLLSRLTRWKYQGKVVYQGNNDLDCICDSLKM